MFLTQEDVAQYGRDGYLIAENLFSPAEVAKMIEAVEKGERVAARTSEGIADNAGKQARFANWKELGNDIWSAASSSPRIVNAARILLGEEIVFFGGKIIFKEARSGGAWEWHQDFGYWYTGCVYPHMLSVFIALDPATRENGCLRVLKGSHKAGRLQHQKAAGGDQIEADPARITRLEGLHETVHCEMSPGSALFFHCNLLHSSSANESDRDRRAFITCYNALNNIQISNGQMIIKDPCPVGKDDAILSF